MAAAPGIDPTPVDRRRSSRAARAALALVVLVYLHNALPYLTMMPRVNVDEPWLMERAYQIMRTGVPRQPMYGLDRAYLLQAGYPYLLAAWMTPFGVGLLQARALAVVLGLGTVLVVAGLGRRLVDPLSGVSAALFLAADSNFLGTARNARTDMPSVFFAACALACYAIGRERPRARWFCLSGVCAGLAMLCHGNAFWIAIVLALWLTIDLGRRLFVAPRTYLVGVSAALTLAPYLLVVLTHLAEVRRQIDVFVPERVPFSSPSQLAIAIAREMERYRSWYFGLVTNAVPNPLLWVFQSALALGCVVVIWRLAARRGRAGDPLLLTLAVGTAVVFAAFINNKVPVYMPHLLIGFALLAAVAVDVSIRAMASAVRAVGGRSRETFVTALVLLFVVGYGGAAAAYYEKWYSSVRKSELVPYERTAATLRALLPPGPKNIYGSPHFWTPFHADADTSFVSYAIGAEAVRHDRPVHLLVDESQWLQDMQAAGHDAFRRSWTTFIERHCAVEATALGTAYGTIAAYQCGIETPSARRDPRIIGAAATYRIAERLVDFTAADLAKWPRYDDPRRRPQDRPQVSLESDALRISGTGWPGIVLDYSATVGEAYLVRVAAAAARDGDLLYLGTWKQAQVLSLAGAASAGMPTPLAHERWFPCDRAFIATATHVPIAIYSEAPRTDFAVSSVQIYRLRPVPAGASVTP
jgi:4-amino-4-deoxy-L-arabinose transferase-like glycosyltransferase